MVRLPLIQITLWDQVCIQDLEPLVLETRKSLIILLKYANGTRWEKLFHNFDGTLDEIRLYDRALTDAEVNYLYFQATTDSDSDGLTNAEEDSLGTSSSNTDTDGDGISDWDEINGYHTYTQIEWVF